MNTINGILLQLNRAVEFANSSYLHEKKLAIILLDHLLETQFRRYAQHILASDYSAWFQQRMYDQGKRSKINRYFEELLSIVKKHNLINEQEYDAITYVHDLKNQAYHELDSIDENMIDIGLTIYFYVMKNNNKIFEYTGPVILLDGIGTEKIDFGQGITKKTKSAFFDCLLYEPYRQNALNFIFSKLKSTHNLSSILKETLTNKINRIEYYIKELNNVIAAYGENFNFYYVLNMWKASYTHQFSHYLKIGRKPKNLDSILLYYAFFRKYKDELQDVEPKFWFKTREKKLMNYRLEHKGKYPHWQNLESLKKRINNLEKQNEDRTLKIFIEIENKLHKLSSDLQSASADYNEYCQPSNHK